MKYIVSITFFCADAYLLYMYIHDIKAKPYVHALTNDLYINFVNV